MKPASVNGGPSIVPSHQNALYTVPKSPNTRALDEVYLNSTWRQARRVNGVLSIPAGGCGESEARLQGWSGGNL
jgi:hypothetical protein